MVLADHGAEVTRVERPNGKTAFIARRFDVVNRSKRSLVDLKSDQRLDVVRDLVRVSDVLIEGFRPGIMERLGLGPEQLMSQNSRLVYGRAAGRGQEEPYAQMAGHDINYVALSGALHVFGRAGEKPTFPANVLADFGGGGMVLAFGVLAAPFNARENGFGQVIDAAMVERTALLSSMSWGLFAPGS